ncbi:unnamed protein product [Colias eurytheme]|nr:unnamed protein product [Colias eurytheme]CAG4972932.1 unnamed protein product [Colias eurytheme]
MESVKQSMTDMAALFNAKMAEFQRDLQNVNNTNNSQPASTSPTSKLAAEFNIFRSFVVASLHTLQSQIEFLSQQYIKWEMRSRRKMLLIHGIPEAPKEIPANLVSKVVMDHMNIPQFQQEAISRCHRLGSTKSDKPRPIIVKFIDVSLRDTIWYSKTSLKGSGYTLSEFLIKERHDVFISARARFGVTNCWTKDGYIIIQASDGKRHKVTMMSELDSIPSTAAGAPGLATTSTNVPHNSKQISNVRPKRCGKGK